MKTSPQQNVEEIEKENPHQKSWSTPTLIRLSGEATEGKSTAFPTETPFTLGPGS